MDLKEYTGLICDRVSGILKGDYPVFTGNIPLGLKKAVSVGIKSAVSGNRSCVISFSVLLRSGDHRSLLDDAAFLRREIAGNLDGGVIIEVPEQSFSAEGVRGEFYWVWQTSFDIKIFNTVRREK